ncbi:MAG TPA: urease accessory UreF family protein [Aggregatilineales bacterium]|nr:urease accessory UreF family protein [Aggregatilineales bacterium]
MQQTPLAWLKLMQITDSALPIGTLSHSFGLETLIAEGLLSVERLPLFIRDYFVEAGRVEGICCLNAYDLLAANNTLEFDSQWLSLNYQLDALKLARESREASAALGRRFLQLAIGLDSQPILERALAVNKSQASHTHHCAAFGLTCGAWAIPPELAVAAFLQQSLVTLVSVCQRLLPLGQTDASHLIWEMKWAIAEVAQQCLDRNSLIPPMFAPLLEVASMRHPDLSTRLFIS